MKCYKTSGQRLLLCQSRKEKGRRRREGNRYPLCFCPFRTQRCKRCNLTECQSKSSRARLHFTPAAEELTLCLCSDTTPGSLPPMGWLGHSELGPKGNKLQQWMEQLSCVTAIALGCLQAQADITAFSRCSWKILGLERMLHILVEAGAWLLLVKIKTWFRVYAQPLSYFAEALNSEDSSHHP